MCDLCRRAGSNCQSFWMVCLELAKRWVGLVGVWFIKNYCIREVALLEWFCDNKIILSRSYEDLLKYILLLLVTIGHYWSLTFVIVTPSVWMC